MVDLRDLWLVIPRHVRGFPRDLAAVMGFVGLTWLGVFVSPYGVTPVQLVLGVLFTLFLPGYAITAVLFPGSDESRSPATESNDEEVHSRPPGGINITERVTYSVGLSIVTVPLVGLLINFSPLTIRQTTLLGAISAFIVLTSILAAVRRWNRSPDDRFRLQFGRYRRAMSTLWNAPTETDRVLNAMVVMALLVAAGSVGYAVIGPDQKQSFTEFYLLHGNETGTLVADDFPTKLREGKSKSVVVGIGNHEHRSVNYLVIVRLQGLQVQNNSTRVVAEQRLAQFRIHLGPGETTRRRHAITPLMAGRNLRLQYLLYVGEPPANPTASNAYRELHLWVNVTAG